MGNPTYGSLSGVLTADFDPSSGQALFPDLNMTGFGIFYIKFRVVSDPADFDITLKHKINILHPNHVGMVVEEEYEIQVNSWLSPLIKLSVMSLDKINILHPNNVGMAVEEQ